MRKWVAFFLIVMFLLPATVSAAPSFDPVPDGYDGYLPEMPVDEKLEEVKREIKDSDTIIDRLVASLLNGFAKGLGWLVGGTNLDMIIFNQSNPMNGKPYQGNTVGGIFTKAEWNNVVNPLRISFSVVAWMFFAVSIAYYGLKVMKDSTNPLKQVDLREKLLAYIGAAAMLAFMHMIFFLLVNLNNAFVQGLYGFVKDNELFQETFSVLGVIDAEQAMTESVVLDAVIHILMQFLVIWFVFLYIFRKFIIGILVVIAPLAAWAFARNRDGMAFKLWLAELTSQIFIQTAHALVIVLYVGFLSNSLGKGNLGTSMAGVLDPLLQFAVGIAGVVAAGALLWNLLRLAFSGKNPKARYLAIKGVQYSLVGFFISVGAIITLNLIRGLIF